ncbi:hypothetical protein Strop_1984 [Salinispora tropica CNB-440]|uniref:Uncharacterized protein n=1 Tax=Salinispora tropica (strain ATCC BAA-916 / DSM 44818 / JCM 13857 / NBRC 105044 / CNB-440) TaxID=369723 RepID=A4X6D8_SALTO|nr:hypothetical protein Strop_1984 [Salinispora tropica CNB-440]
MVRVPVPLQVPLPVPVAVPFDREWSRFVSRSLGCSGWFVVLWAVPFACPVRSRSTVRLHDGGGRGLSRSGLVDRVASGVDRVDCRSIQDGCQADHRARWSRLEPVRTMRTRDAGAVVRGCPSPTRRWARGANRRRWGCDGITDW